MGTEINEKTKFKSARVQIIEHLRFMLVAQHIDRLDFNKNSIEANEVGLIDLRVLADLDN